MSEHFMEDAMPTPCLNCSKIFDFSDEGTTSSKWFPDKVICDECGNIEKEEIERDEEIEDLKSTLEDARYTVKDCIEQLKKLGVNNP